MKVLIIDIETTGFSYSKDSIIEIGAVSLDLDNGNIEPVFESTCKETIFSESHKDAWAFSNSDLTFEMIQSAESFDYIAKQFQTVLSDHPKGVTSYGRSFDVGFLSNRGLQFGKLIDCPMQLMRDVCKIPSKDKKGYKTPSLQESYDHLFPKSGYNEKHRGLDDAVKCAEITYELYKRKLLKV